MRPGCRTATFTLQSVRLATSTFQSVEPLPQLTLPRRVELRRRNKGGNCTPAPSVAHCCFIQQRTAREFRHRLSEQKHYNPACACTGQCTGSVSNKKGDTRSVSSRHRLEETSNSPRRLSAQHKYSIGNSTVTAPVGSNVW